MFRGVSQQINHIFGHNMMNINILFVIKSGFEVGYVDVEWRNYYGEVGMA